MLSNPRCAAVGGRCSRCCWCCLRWRSAGPLSGSIRPLQSASSAGVRPGPGGGVQLSRWRRPRWSHWRCHSLALSRASAAAATEAVRGGDQQLIECRQFGVGCTSLQCRVDGGGVASCGFRWREKAAPAGAGVWWRAESRSIRGRQRGRCATLDAPLCVSQHCAHGTGLAAPVSDEESARRKRTGRTANTPTTAHRARGRRHRGARLGGKLKMRSRATLIV